ncbi:MAG: KH domain-containing protein [Candidatus Hadarchaeales archaeon]
MYLRLPKDRIGVAIGPDGSVKKEIERKTGTTITLDSETGEVKIDGKEPLGVLRAGEIIKAIARGFSPERAFRLLREDQFLDIIDITEYVGDSRKSVERMKGRIIGKDGRAREAIERATGALISVYGKTVGIIGEAEQLRFVREAIDLLLRGAEHSTLYRFLEQKRKKMRESVDFSRGDKIS